ncbi:uncharacterized protein LOC129966275 [Argiope bruennichi]|uniref:uncharacterized protein LOC129966275 n=1 Tax=Argiope bruennichi TaxID=94029 RepID=UPI00249585A4|nr:uncharacterized protein LOC129966275 [Argiope bruennichi]
MPRNSEQSDFEKGVIVDYHRNVRSLRDLSSELNIPKSTVAFVIKKWKVRDYCGNVLQPRRTMKRLKTEGTVNKEPRSGRLRFSSKRADATLTRLSRKNRYTSSATLAREWNESTSVITNSRTVCRRLCEASYKAQVPRKNTVLTKAMWEKLLEGAKVHKNWSISQWRQVIFSDENHFSLMCEKPGHV